MFSFHDIHILGENIRKYKHRYILRMYRCDLNIASTFLLEIKLIFDFQDLSCKNSLFLKSIISIIERNNITLPKF